MGQQRIDLALAGQYLLAMLLALAFEYKDVFVSDCSLFAAHFHGSRFTIIIYKLITDHSCIAK